MQNYQYSDDYFLRLRTMWNKISYNIISKYINRGLLLFKPKVILDLGCGNGIYHSQLKKKDELLYGIDISVEAINACKKLPYSLVQNADVTQLPFKNNSFDMVFSSEVIEHIHNYSQFISELYRILKPGKGLVITTTCYATSIYTFLRKIKNLEKKRIISNEIIRYIKGFRNIDERAEFIRKWCFEDLGGHFHGFMLNEFRLELQEMGYQIVESGVFYPVEAIRLGQNSWLKKAFAKESKWSVTKRIISLPMWFFIKILNAIFKLFHISANNLYVIAIKK